MTDKTDAFENIKSSSEKHKERKTEKMHIN